MVCFLRTDTNYGGKFKLNKKYNGGKLVVVFLSSSGRASFSRSVVPLRFNGVEN